MIFLYLFSNILINYPKDLKFKKEAPHSTPRDIDLKINIYIKKGKTNHRLASIKYFTFFLCALLIAINTLRIFYDLNIWAIHFIFFSISFFIILSIGLTVYKKGVIKNKEILLLMVNLISFIEIVLMIIFPIDMTFKEAYLVVIFNIIHGASLSLFILYIIIIIRNLTKSNSNKEPNKDLLIHIYSVFWILSALLVYFGFGYLLDEVDWLNPNYILLSIALILLIGTLFFLKPSNKKNIEIKKINET